jgi:hypothetical protein
LIVLSLIGTRLIIVSNYNTDTAVTMLRVGGTLDSVLGSTIPLLPLLLPSVFILLLIFRQWYTAIVAAICSLLVAVVSPAYKGWGSVPVQAWDTCTWFWLGVTDPVQRWLWRDLNDVIVACWNWSVGVGPDSWEKLLSSQSLAKHERAGSLGEVFSREPILSLAVVGAVVASLLALELDLVSGGVEVDFETKGQRIGEFLFMLLVRLILGLGVAFIVSLGFSYASSIYPIPPRDAAVWGDSLRRVWQPPERLVLTTGKVEIGYPLGVKDGWQIVLLEPTRRIQYLKPANLGARSVCDLGLGPRRSPFWGSTDLAPTTYPPCFPKAVPARKSGKTPAQQPLKPPKIRVLVPSPVIPPLVQP